MSLQLVSLHLARVLICILILINYPYQSHSLSRGWDPHFSGIEYDPRVHNMAPKLLVTSMSQVMVPRGSPAPGSGLFSYQQNMVGCINLGHHFPKGNCRHFDPGLVEI
jgi:hypothetical protein